MAPLQHHHVLLLLLFIISTTAAAAGASSSSPFTPKSAFLRYYARKVPHHRPLPSFLLSKLSPLSPQLAAASFPSSSSLSSFCAAANILCPLPSSSLSLAPAPVASPSSFSSYSANPADFSNYGDDTSGGTDSFTLYSSDANIPIDTFRRYSHSSSDRSDSFNTYASDGNVVTDNFTSYASSAASASGSFSSYAHNANVPNLKFTNYDTSAVSRQRTFSSYSDDTNSGDQNFAGYGKHANSAPSSFTSYAKNSNTIGSTFSSYTEDGNDGGGEFTSYGGDGNGPKNDFRSYGEGSNGATHGFKLYRDRANVGDDSFRSYAEHGNAGRAEFENYGRSFNPGVDSFQGYGVGSSNQEVGFTSYAGDNTTFKSYAKTGVTFATYKNTSNSHPPTTNNHRSPTRWVEPGKFFREDNLNTGTRMIMADIRNKMPERSFLPRSVAEKLPFSATELGSIFQVPVDTALGKAMADTVSECGRAPSRGETKRCVTLAEDMVDFAVSVLGDDVAVRSTDNVRGWGRDVVIGEVKGVVDKGEMTKAVSCHQSLFPYLVYYCHSVPKVRVYEAEILDAGTKERINRAVAICHLDTSDWSPAHGAFVALGSRPGEIEVCHWIFEGDMTWTAADY